jgi:hypothetical protein
MQTIERVRQCEVGPPSLHNPLCPPALDQIVLQALARDRDERYQSSSEMADALDDVVYASRFQATHLAQTMRVLFPVDAGGDPQAAQTARAARLATASVSPSRSSVSTPRSSPGASKPNPTTTRSPTVPPAVPLTPITAGSYRIPPSRSNITAPPSPPGAFLTRPMLGPVPGWVFISGLLLLGFAFVGGAIWTLRDSSSAAASKKPIPKIRFLDIAFQSTPSAADVFIAGSNEYLGRTPFRRKVEYRDDRTTFVVFRLAGYLETTREVRPDWSGDVTLLPQPAPPAPVPPAAPPPAAPKPSEAPAPTRPAPTAHTPPKTVDPFEKAVKPGKVRGKPRSKGTPDKSEPRSDPFDKPKSSPFE